MLTWFLVGRKAALDPALLAGRALGPLRKPFSLLRERKKEEDTDRQKGNGVFTKALIDCLRKGFPGIPLSRAIFTLQLFKSSGSLPPLAASFTMICL